MKHSHNTRLTALMFSAAAVCAGMLATGCTHSGYNVYGPPPVSEIDSSGELPPDLDAEVLYGPPPVSENDDLSSVPEEISIPDAEIDLDAMTDADFRNMTDEQLMAIGKQYTRLPTPAFCGTLSAGFPDVFSMTKQAADNQEEAFALVCKEFYPKPEGVYEEQEGRYWLYEAGSGVAYWYLVPDKAFFDPETQTLNADVTEENMLLLAAMRGIPGERVLGAFVTDEGGRLTCKEYYLLYSGGDYGLSDTATLYGFMFSADKATGKLTDYQSDRYGFSRTVEIPGTYHPYPDE